ncbi:hypothetical protein CEXT_77081 [Caerostris extrusa]|uniref:Uncharacterized protein n=1 Tax=Caerostris extrusa TaxID=172846 RepID=A0AAV4MTF2_CAEEX|nr:hypothetical protein CEXT_77081 [Caerostris extrusa]
MLLVARRNGLSGLAPGPSPYFPSLTYFALTTRDCSSGRSASDNVWTGTKITHFSNLKEPTEAHRSLQEHSAFTRTAFLLYEVIQEITSSTSLAISHLSSLFPISFTPETQEIFSFLCPIKGTRG